MPSQEDMVIQRDSPGREAPDRRKPIYVELPPPAGPLDKVAAVVLLGGSVRATALKAAIGRSVLDLPVERGCSLLDLWRRECAALAVWLGRRSLPVRVVVERGAAEPSVATRDPHVAISVERDPLAFRGTGGVLKDLAEVYPGDAYLLVANAAQLLQEPLPQLAESLARPGADVALITHRAGEPSGLMLVRCGCLAEVPACGFNDMKEQALPAIARRHVVRVVERASPTGLPVRTLSDYTRALRVHHRRRCGGAAGGSANPGWEDWQPAFSIVEDGANVHPEARAVDSVVLAGATVQEGAVVAGSLLCGGAVVRRGQMVVDEIVAGVWLRPVRGSAGRAP